MNKNICYFKNGIAVNSFEYGRIARCADGFIQPLYSYKHLEDFRPEVFNLMKEAYTNGKLPEIDHLKTAILLKG